MLIEIHMLQNHAPSNLNRDDTGAPKDALFGGIRRGRISSQCLKRSIRTSEQFKKAMEGHIGTRTVFFPTKVQEALANSTIDKKEVAQVASIAANCDNAIGNLIAEAMDKGDLGHRHRKPESSHSRERKAILRSSDPEYCGLSR